MSVKKVARFWIRYILPIIIIVVAGAKAKQMMEDRPDVRQDGGSGSESQLVEVVEVHSTEMRIDIHSQGTVIPARQVVLQPQVTGAVSWLSEDLVPGGVFLEGTDVLEIEDRDYRYAVDLAEADVERAEAGMELEEGRQQVAEEEWEMFQGDFPAGDEAYSLALREPQLDDATAMVELAEIRLRQARLNLSRTTVTAPFNSFVREEAVDVGQLISPASRIATLVGIDTFWVQLSLPYDRLARISIPGFNGSEEGASVRIWQDIGDERMEREGRVIRVLYDLEPMGMMARVLVEIEDPLLLGNHQPPPTDEDEPDGSDEEGLVDVTTDDEIDKLEVAELPLLIGSFVQAEIEGNTIEHGIELDRRYLQEGDRVFILNEDNTLSVRDVHIIWEFRETVLVGQGLNDGDRVITSWIPVPIEGMSLRTERLDPSELQERPMGSGGGGGGGGHGH